jgi:RNA polymerase sigma-70 factor (ECF subfamily)
VRRKPEGLSDTELAALAKKGDAAAFEEIYDRHAPGVTRALASFAGPDQDLLDDLAQDVFLRVIEGLPSYVPSRPFSHWLYTIALNVGRNHARRSSRVIPVDPLDLEAIAPLQEDASNGSDGIIGKRLMRLVSRLPVQMQEVVSLRIGSGMSYGEIAEMLGIPEGTARSRMFNAVAILRRQLTPNDTKRSSER